MTLITEQKDLVALCARLRECPFLTIDTEFLRDKTYYPVLCLVQMAGPGVDAAAIDPLADSLDPTPVFELLADSSVVKVFHAARQDLEIFYNLTGKIPHPIFDTQVAAMVCGYGDQIGYYNLVQNICNEHLDKGAQFTDWSRRPLSGKQMSYALHDVTYLRDIYLHLEAVLKREGRHGWMEEEMAVLTTPATYQNPHEEAWRRIKIRSDRPKVLAVLREVAAWRESEAQRRDVPRNRVVRDETLAEVALNAPETAEELGHVRGIGADMARGKVGQALLAAIQRGLATPKEQCPQGERRSHFPPDLTPVLEMLKMLLKIQCAQHAVAPRLVASSDDLELLAMNDNADIPALKGWRHEVFGREALALKSGKVALTLKDRKIGKIDL
jgi:ribonuclease D